MKQIHIDRLLKLADHLEHGQLGHQVFDFYSYNVGKDGGHCAASCGYAGCAVGECPIVFPEDWIFNDNGWPVLRPERLSVSGSIREFFGVDENESGHLFVPKSQTPWKYGGEYLKGSATNEQVAANIRAFVTRQK